MAVFVGVAVALITLTKPSAPPPYIHPTHRMMPDGTAVVVIESFSGYAEVGSGIKIVVGADGSVSLRQFEAHRLVK